METIAEAPAEIRRQALTWPQVDRRAKRDPAAGFDPLLRRLAQLLDQRLPATPETLLELIDGVHKMAARTREAGWIGGHDVQHALEAVRLEVRAMEHHPEEAEA